MDIDTIAGRLMALQIDLQADDQEVASSAGKEIWNVVMENELIRTAEDAHALQALALTLGRMLAENPQSEHWMGILHLMRLSVLKASTFLDQMTGTSIADREVIFTPLPKQLLN